MEPRFDIVTHRRRQRDQRVALAMGALLLSLFLAIAVVVLFLGGPPRQPVAAVAPPTPSAAISPLPSLEPNPAATLVTPATTAWPVITAAPFPPEPTVAAGPTPDPIKTAPPSTPTPAPGQPIPSPVPPPANDSIDRPTVIAALPASHMLTTVGATAESGDPECHGTASGGTVWFSFKPSSTVTVSATTFGSDYDTTLHVGTRGASGGFDTLACNDDSAGDVQSALRLELNANVTYLFMVGSFGESVSGELVFTLQAAEPMPTVSLTLDELGTFDSRGRATLSGTHSCSSRLDGVYIEVSLSQRVGRQIFTGWGYGELERCSTRTRSWSLLVDSSGGTFGDEPAFATVYASYCDDFDCRTVSSEQDVTLVSAAPSPSPPPVTPSPSPSPSATPDEAAATEPSIQPVP